MKLNISPSCFVMGKTGEWKETVEGRHLLVSKKKRKKKKNGEINA